MNHLHITLITFSILLLGVTNFSTNGSNGDLESLFNDTDSLANVHPSLLDDDPWNDTLEYTPQDIINLRDTLIGNFSGQGIEL